MEWLKKMEAKRLGICANCIYRDEFVTNYCTISGTIIQKGMPNTCDFREEEEVGSCESCKYRSSEIQQCRGIDVCKCLVADRDVHPTRVLKIRTDCKKYVKK